ncbi:hypothetical protein FVE85_6851 [Porphyridium purpureum]|uniref:Uncharacterized protein n=1 Tax=Porphyridium purpureum TaxID=35688 RepID=A0A5J4Z6F5_PORPP|nr:hypothetical protein FVE85_6851 [Porphyridium purpureum]|eukprot:POR7508..scf295_1
MAQRSSSRNLGVPSNGKPAVPRIPSLRDFTKKDSSDLNSGNLQKTLEARASQRDLNPEQFKMVRRGSSSYLMPLANEEKDQNAQRMARAASSKILNLDGKAEEELTAQQKERLEAKTREMLNNDFLTQKKSSSVRYRKMVGNEVAEPPMYFAELDKGTVQDVFSVLHNSVRKEMQDLYYIVGSLNKRCLEIAKDDIQDFYEWLAVFALLLEFFFQFEDVVLFPWVETRVALTGALSKEGRASRQQLTNAAIEGIEDCEFKFEHLPPGEVMPQLIHAIEKLSSVLLEHFGVTEKDVVPAAVEAFTEAEGLEFERKFIDTVRASDENHTIMAMLMRPIKNEMRLKDLQGKYLQTPGFFKQVRFRKDYFAAKKNFHEEHTRLVYIFFNRWNLAHAGAENEEWERSRQ